MNAMTILTGIIVILAFALPAATQAQGTLDELLVRTMDGNASLRAAAARYEAAKLQAPQVSALPDLRVGAGYFVVPIETRLGPQRVAFSVSQSFPWFGQLGAEERAALARARQAHAEYLDVRNRLLLDVKSAWYRYFVLERSIALSREQLAFLTTVRDLVRNRYEAGNAGYSDVLRLEMEAEELTTRIRSLEDGRTAVTRQFEQFTGAPITRLPAVPDALDALPALPADEALHERLKVRNPLLAKAAEEGEYWRHRGEAARLMGYPMFTVGLNYIVIDPPTGGMVVENPGRDAIQPQLGISIPLFGSRYSAMEQQAAQQELAARELRDDQLGRLRVLLEERLRDHRDARRRLDLNTRLLAIAQQTIDVGLQEYSAGGTSLEDLLAVERSLLRYALAKEQAEADLRATHDSIMYLTAEE